MPGFRQSSMAKNTLVATTLLASFSAAQQQVESQASVLTVPSGKSGYDRFSEFIKLLAPQTYKVNSHFGMDARAVHSSGGAAGGVVSEGQGYGLAIAAGTYLGLDCGDDPSKNNCSAVQQTFYELFLGWQQAAKFNADISVAQTCQKNKYCQAANDQTFYACLPSWKVKDDLSGISTACPWAKDSLCTGSATDGEMDAVKGMILMTLATAQNRPVWYQEVADWAYGTCQQIYEDDSVEDSSKDGPRILKLGTCWGGFGDQGQNPSYHDPATLRMCAEFMEVYKPVNVAKSDLRPTKENWKAIYTTSYDMLRSNINPKNGLVTNWWKYSTNGTGEKGFSGSGTPSTEFGSEASRSVWRIAMDHIWFASADNSNSDYLSAKYLSSTNSEADKSNLWSSKDYLSILSNYMVSNQIDVGQDLVTDFGRGPCDSVHPDWSHNAFMFGPVTCSMMFNGDSSSKDQAQALLTKWSKHIDDGQLNDYYSGSWLALSTLTIRGDFGKARAWVNNMSERLRNCTTQHCSVCTVDGSSETCTQCSPGFTLTGSGATATCEPITCDGSVANCATCTTTTKPGDTCYACDEGYKLNGDGKCQIQCAAGQFPDPHSLTKCDTCSPIKDATKKKSICSSLTCTSAGSSKCTKCVDPLATGDQCDTCVAGYTGSKDADGNLVCTFDCTNYNQCLKEIASTEDGKNAGGSGNTNSVDGKHTWGCCAVYDNSDGSSEYEYKQSGCKTPIAGMTLDNKWWVKGTPTAPPAGTCDTPTPSPTPSGCSGQSIANCKTPSCNKNVLTCAACVDHYTLSQDSKTCVHNEPTPTSCADKSEQQCTGNCHWDNGTSTCKPQPPKPKPGCKCPKKTEHWNGTECVTCKPNEKWSNKGNTCIPNSNPPTPPKPEPCSGKTPVANCTSPSCTDGEPTCDGCEPGYTASKDKKQCVANKPTPPKPTPCSGKTPVANCKSPSCTDDEPTCDKCQPGYTASHDKKQCVAFVCDANCDLCDDSKKCIADHCINGWKTDASKPDGCTCPNAGSGVRIASSDKCPAPGPSPSPAGGDKRCNVNGCGKCGDHKFDSYTATNKCLSCMDDFVINGITYSYTPQGSGPVIYYCTPPKDVPDCYHTTWSFGTPTCTDNGKSKCTGDKSWDAKSLKCVDATDSL